MGISGKGTGGLFQLLFQYTGVIKCKLLYDGKHQELVEVEFRIL